MSKSQPNYNQPAIPEMEEDDPPPTYMEAIEVEKALKEGKCLEECYKNCPLPPPKLDKCSTSSEYHPQYSEVNQSDDTVISQPTHFIPYPEIGESSNRTNNHQNYPPCPRRSRLGERNAEEIICPACLGRISPTIQRTPSGIAYLSCILLFLCGCHCGLCLIPCCLDDCLDSIEVCPICNYVIGKDIDHLHSAFAT